MVGWDFIERPGGRRWIDVSLAAVQFLVFACTVAWGSLALFPYIGLPAMMSAALGRPRLTALLVGQGVLLAALSAVLVGPAPHAHIGLQMPLLVVEGLVSYALALTVAHRDRQRARSWERLLTTALDSEIDSHIFLRPVLDDDGGVCDFVCIEANPSACAFLGREREQLVGTRVRYLFAGISTGPLFAWCANLVHGSGPLLRDDVPVAGDTRGDIRFLDLRAVLVEGLVDLTWRDVTGRHRTAQLIRESEERYRLLAENSSDLVFQARSDGVLTWVSGSVRQALGWDPAELVGWALPELVHPEDALAAASIVSSPRAEQRLRGEVRVRSASGEFRWFSVHVALVPTPGDRAMTLVGGLHDIHDEVQARQVARDAEARFRALATASSDVVLHARADHVILWVSPSAERTLGWDPAALTGQRTVDLVHPGDVARLGTEMLPRLQRREAARGTFRIRRQDGHYRWMEVASDTLPDPDGGRVVRMRDVDAEVLSHRALEREAGTDPLTGLANRRQALARIEALTSGRRTGTRSAVLFIDADYFKSVNDAFGHEAGDRVLQSIAARLDDSTRATDITARLGGDEFLVALSGVTDLAEATQIAEKIRARCADPIDLRDGVTTHTTVTIGLALQEEGEGAAELIRRADRALYVAKSHGRDLVIVDEV